MPSAITVIFMAVPVLLCLIAWGFLFDFRKVWPRWVPVTVLGLD